MTINIMARIFVYLLLFRGLGSGNRTFDFDCGIDLSSCGIVTVEYCGEFFLDVGRQ